MLDIAHTPSDIALMWAIAHQQNAKKLSESTPAFRDSRRKLYYNFLITKNLKLTSKGRSLLKNLPVILPNISRDWRGLFFCFEISEDAKHYYLQRDGSWAPTAIHGYFSNYRQCYETFMKSKKLE